jgi:3-dehydroquinate synthetase
VAIGLNAAAQLSVKLGALPPADAPRIESVLAAHALPVRLRAALPLPALLAAMARDKKVRGGLPRFVVLNRIGEAGTRDGVPLDLAAACFREIGAE